ncbi:unnamed protein product [Lupinus luteus]|uniref:Eukaryotic translation initiation factor 4C n=1 Tax=Lupinus luteus TaxID=3873 RepID=A0AAV1XIT4_LUPLU
MGVGSLISLFFLFLISGFFSFDVVYSYTRPPARKTVFTPHSEDDSSPQQVHISQVRRDHMMITWITENSNPNMLKNKGKRGKNEVDYENRELGFKEDGQEYAQVIRMLGNGRCEAMCIDGTKRLCHIRGKMHKKYKTMGVGSLISLVFLFLISGFFEFDVVYSYTRPPARKTIFTPHSEDDSSPQQVHISQVRRDHMMITWITENSNPNMPKNKGKRGKNEVDDEKRELIFKEDGQEYAHVLRMLGNSRCKAMCIDGTKRLCHICGKMHKKVWIATDFIVKRNSKMITKQKQGNIDENENSHSKTE